MTIDAIREAVHAQPFRPFKLRTAGGSTINVSHPDYIAFGPRGRTIVVYREDDSFKILDTMLVAEIDVNGSKTSKR